MGSLLARGSSGKPAQYASWLMLLALLFGCQSAHLSGHGTSEAIKLHKEGKFSEGMSIARKELESIESTKGSDSLETAAALNNLAMQYLSLGKYPEAELLFKKALAIRESRLGKDHPDVATSLNNLAMLYTDTGDYAKAEPLYKRALDIRRAKLDKDHPDLAASLNNLATLDYSLGNYEEASQLLKEAISIWEKTLGPQDPALAAALGNLAALHASLGRYDEAESLLKRALDMREKALGKDHPDTVVLANNLAAILQEVGRYDEAVPLYLRALAVVEQTQGAGHPNLAVSMGNLAGIYAVTGKPAQAEDLYIKALAILEASLGTNHPAVAACLENLGSLYAMQKKYEQAHTAFKRAQGIDAEVIDQVFGFTSEEKKYEFLLTKQSSLERSMSLVVRHMAHSPQARRDALDLWLSRKGTILEAQRLFQKSLVSAENPEAVSVYNELSLIRDQLCRLAFQAPGSKEAEGYREQTSNLQKKKQEVEARLSRLSRSYALYQSQFKADSRQIASAMPANSALIEFVLVNLFDFGATNPNSQWQPPHYVAFVLQAGGTGQVDLVDLGPAETIDRCIGKLKKSLQAGAPGEKGPGASVEASRELYNLVFRKLKAYARDSRTLFISTDGNLSVIPFEVMLGPDNKYLIEDYVVTYLTSGRDILGFGRTPGILGKALLVGNPDFDLTSETGQEGPQGREGETRRAVSSSFLPADIRGLQFTPLPGTEEELLSIMEIMGPDKAEMYTGAAARKSLVYSKKAPRILHLATHGFFLGDMQTRDPVPSAPSRAISVTSASALDSKGPALKVNPLLRSGLVLAGANRSWSSENPGDGFLTAEDALGLDLDGTEMVVLSACQTGLGEIRVGEGIYGLRRALFQAGAGSLIMSMWSVPDRETKELMVRFYRQLDSGAGRSGALRQAALDEMKVVRERYGYANPYYWGAFVFLGSP